MERYTMRLTDEHWRNFDPWECCGQDKYCNRGCHDEGGCVNGCIVPKLYARLAAYEDTGLEPEQIKHIVKIDNEYVKASEEGRLLVLPCKVGDELWFEKNGKIQCETIDMITADQSDEDDEWYISIYTMSVSVFSEDIGRLVFLTLEEAEAALKAEEE